jgi:multimeric flavodoxin WrbA
MRVMTLLGSPHANGNTGTVLAWIEEQLHASGHQVDRAHIADYKVAGCLGCWACQSGHDLCIQDDDANALFRRVIAADALLLAAPVYCWGFPGPMKSLLDRSVCLTGDASDPNYTTKLQGKPFGLVTTAGGPLEDNADIMIRAFQAMAEYMKTLPAKHFFVPNCTTPDALDDAVKSRVSAFAKDWLKDS